MVCALVMKYRNLHVFMVVNVDSANDALSNSGQIDIGKLIEYVNALYPLIHDTYATFLKLR